MDVKVKGLAELQKFLNELPAKMEAKVMRGALGAGAKVVLQEVKENVPVQAGTLRDGLKISTGIRKGRVSAKIKATGRHAHIARWIEYGTSPYVMAAEDSDKPLNLRLSAKRGKLVRVSMTTVNRRIKNGMTVRERGVHVNLASTGAGPSIPRWVTMRKHPGIKAKPFMRSALDNKSNEAIKTVAEYIKGRLLTKHGLDTSGITFGDDE